MSCANGRTQRVGLKHFFSASESISQQTNLGRQSRVGDTKLKTPRTFSVMGIYAIHLDGIENDLHIEAVHCINF